MARVPLAGTDWIPGQGGLLSAALCLSRAHRSGGPAHDARIWPVSPQERGIKYFLISYTDLFGAQRAKLVPAAAIAEMQKDGAGFAGFATWLDMTPAHPDLFAMPDSGGLIQLPWKPEVAWVAGRLRDGRTSRSSRRRASC